MRILTATRQDAEEILAVVHAAFRPIAAEYGMPSLPPLEETVDDLLADFRTHVVLKAVEDGRIVGSVRGAIFQGRCEVGRLVVDPAAQGRGIGGALAREIERRFPEARCFELFTGHHSGASLHIYQKLGYIPFRIETVSPTLQLIHLRKTPAR